MTSDATLAAAEAGAPLAVRKIGIDDLKDALAQGFDDFKAKPSHVIFLTLIYPIAGLFLARMTDGGRLLPLFFPLAAGFALLGPFAALGLYELSRRREQGLDMTFMQAFSVLQSPAIGSIAALGGILCLIFIAWLATAWAIFNATLGAAWTPSGDFPSSYVALIRQILSTRAGWNLIILGNMAGFFFAALVLIVGSISFPLLLDRNVGLVSAVATSIRAVEVNPTTMAMWGLIVAIALILGSLPFFIGLAVVIPVLGHTTWHLYRKIVPP